MAKFTYNPSIIHFRVLIHLIGFIKTTSCKWLKYYLHYIDSPWNDCIDTGRSTQWYRSFSQGGPTDYGSHSPVPVAISSGEAEYISAAVACMRASHLRMLIHVLRFMGYESYSQDVVNLEPARIIIENEAAITESLDMILKKIMNI